jgi:hypothetical protein
MKLAWLCYPRYNDSEIEIKFHEPEDWQYRKVVPIVYAEIKK